MDRIADWILEVVTELELTARMAGLFLAGVADSSVLSLPEINDALIFYLSTLSPSTAPYYVLASTLGSVVGCLVLHRIASWKAPHYVDKISTGRFRAAHRLYQRYGAWTLVVPALLPPPCPFKIFVLSSGAFGLPFPRFLVAVLVGRSVRYTLGAVLAVKYGEEVLGVLRAYGPHILAIVVAAAILALAYGLKRSLERAGIEASQ